MRQNLTIPETRTDPSVYITYGSPQLFVVPPLILNTCALTSQRATSYKAYWLRKDVRVRGPRFFIDSIPDFFSV